MERPMPTPQRMWPILLARTMFGELLGEVPLASPVWQRVDGRPKGAWGGGQQQLWAQMLVALVSP
eukprot:8864596-Lingulodinium_polyedra.AAC.1